MTVVCALIAVINVNVQCLVMKYWRFPIDRSVHVAEFILYNLWCYMPFAVVDIEPA